MPLETHISDHAADVSYRDAAPNGKVVVSGHRHCLTSFPAGGNRAWLPITPPRFGEASAGAIFLILELSHPFSGVMQISSSLPSYPCDP
jgi:hypothetical protein